MSSSTTNIEENSIADDGRSTDDDSTDDRPSEENSDEVYEHDILGPCPVEHDRSFSRDCAAILCCWHCRTAFNDRPQYIRGCIQDCRRFEPEANEEDHEPADPYIPRGERPHRCTEQIPDGPNGMERLDVTDVADWEKDCPSRDRRAYRPTWPCLEVNCNQKSRGIKLKFFDHDDTLIDSDEEGYYEDDYQEENKEDPPGNHRPRWVCRRHITAAKAFWEQPNLFNAHLVGTCNTCRVQLQELYPGGHNTCTCPNLLDRWQCRRCYEKKVRRLQTNFRQRVMANYTGEVVRLEDRRMIGPLGWPDIDDNSERPGPGLGYYFRQWRAVRAMLVRRNTCYGPNDPQNICGGKRRNQTMVMDCRSCGGVIVKPTVAEVRTVRTTRSMQRRQGTELQELEFQHGRSALGLRTAGTARRQETRAEREERERREEREQGRGAEFDNLRREWERRLSEFDD